MNSSEKGIRRTPNTHQSDNIRLRYRLLVGLEVNMKDNLQVGFRLGTADDPGANPFGGIPISDNTTLQGNGSKKFIYVDAAYGKWTPIHDDTWMVAGTIGKMNNPFQVSPMLFDANYTPEGGALQATYKIDDWNSLAFNGAAFVLSYAGNGAENMSFLYGGQAIWNAQWTKHISSSLGVSALDIVNRDQLTDGSTNSVSGGFYPLNVYPYNSGNSLGAGGAPLYNFNPVVADASVTYTLDSFPLYPGKFPIKLAGEYMINPGAPGSGGMAGDEPNGNQGYNFGVIFGHATTKGTWDIGYRYEALDANAWYAQVVNVDNEVYNGGGFPGATNVKGHLFTMDYMLANNLDFMFLCYINSQIGNSLPAPYAGTSSAIIHTMAGVMWSF
ncbi:MAG: putative porin [Verrucomicrobiota bacterium]|nr:putative porin [Verrucomicrobiota bacterium]